VTDGLPATTGRGIVVVVDALVVGAIVVAVDALVVGSVVVAAVEVVPGSVAVVAVVVAVVVVGTVSAGPSSRAEAAPATVRQANAAARATRSIPAVRLAGRLTRQRLLYRTRKSC
jgi:hypothetical protein